ncbi:MAG TPA: hypothetical protein VLH79_06825 [Chthonomonadales bacterium]|nr:hypothetical protein [Chthonomonadales bacterium]
MNPWIKPCRPTKQTWSYGTLGTYTPAAGEEAALGCYCGMYAAEDDGGDEGFNLVFGMMAPCATTKFQISGTRGGSISDRVLVYCNGVVKYDSGCSFTDFDSGLVVIPADTTTMQIEVQADCSGGTGTYWSFFFQVRCDW